jgi:hypothetical protein
MENTLQSCQVRMVQIMEVVRAFSAKKIFPEKIFSDDQSPPHPPVAKKFSVSVPF